MVKIYLAGPIQHDPNDGKTWRNAVKQDWPLEDWEDPLDNYDFTMDQYIHSSAAEDVHYEDDDVEIVTNGDIVEEDKQAIDDCDSILVGWRTDVSTCGTPMEILYGWQNDKHIVVWNRGDEPAEGLSPWLQYHADQIVQNREVAIDLITNE